MGHRRRSSAGIDAGHESRRRSSSGLDTGVHESHHHAANESHHVADESHASHRHSTKHRDSTAHDGAKSNHPEAWADNGNQGTAKATQLAAESSPKSPLSKRRRAPTSDPVSRELGISIDLKQKLPAGDRWPPGVELNRTLLRATLIGEGKKLPNRPQSQGASTASRRRV